MPPYIQGLLFGFLFILSFGPGFFALVQTSMQQGIKPAFALAMGISSSDAVYVTLALFGVSAYLEDPSVRFWLGVFGTIMLIGYAIYSWFKKPKIPSRKEKTFDYTRLYKFFFKGFFLNGLNPFILVFWVSIISAVSVRFEYNIVEQRYFFAGVLCTIISMDTMKVLFSNRLKYLITPARILIVNRSMGVILMLFGLRVLYFLVDNYWI